MSIPIKDGPLAAWTINAKTRIAADYADFGLTLLQSTAYTAVSDAFIAAWTAINTPGEKSPALVAAKNSAKVALLKVAREIYAFVQANFSVLDSNKVLLGVKVRKTSPSRRPAPLTAPVLSVESVVGTRVRLNLKDADLDHRGKPANVWAAAVISHIGATAPSNVADYKYEGVTGQTTTDVIFPADTPAGSRVWLAACWLNFAKESGPTCFPISTTLQGGGVGTGTDE